MGSQDAKPYDNAELLESAPHLCSPWRPTEEVSFSSMSSNSSIDDTSDSPAPPPDPKQSNQGIRLTKNRFPWLFLASRVGQDKNIINHWRMYTGPEPTLLEPVIASLVNIWSLNSPQNDANINVLHNRFRRIICSIMVQFDHPVKTEQIYIHVLRKIKKAIVWLKYEYWGYPGQADHFLNFYRNFYNIEFLRVKEIVLVYLQNRGGDPKEMSKLAEQKISDFTAEFSKYGHKMFHHKELPNHKPTTNPQHK